jgi:arylsulfatase A-like enzyme
MNKLSGWITGISMFLSGISVTAQTVKHSISKLPNIVLIFVDDMGYGDLSCFGAIQYKTPNLDRMAAEGERFTNFYAAQPICTASRAGILTGCYPNRIGIKGAFFPHSKIGLNPKEEIIPELLKNKNYISMVIGKWHLGDAKQFMPLQQGFDQYLGLPYSNDMWPVNYDGTPVTPENQQRQGNYPVLPLIRGNKKIRDIKTLQDQAELTTIYTSEAVKFIQENKDRPFFLYLAHSMPHVPIAVSDKFKSKSGQGLYGDVVMELDWSVGQVLAALDETGLTNNTLVIFTSDNGPWLNFGNHAGSAGGLREGKMTNFEGGQRVPCLMKWPGVIPEGIVCNKLACTIDILPTLAEITGAPLPEKKIDGVSILPLLTGDSLANPRRFLYYYFHENSLDAVRMDNWKLVFPHEYVSYEGSLPGNDGYPGKTIKRKTGLALYNMRRDPGERYDVKSIYPEVVSKLIKLADQAREDLGDDLTGNHGKNRREPGILQEN